MRLRTFTAAALGALALVLGLASFGTAGTESGSDGGAVSRAAKPLPHIKHVFIVVLENENASSTFGPKSPAPYLAKTLPKRGAFVPRYWATGHLSLDNYISMVSGQAPNPQTQADCQFFNEFATAGVFADDGQLVGQGCVYPSPDVQTIANQLQDAGLSWKGYMQDMAAGGPGVPKTCRHPAVNSRDPWQDATEDDQYATRHNPFVYFHSIIDFPTCDRNDVDLKRMPGDLKKRRTTASYNFITPDLCNDGHDEPCVDGRPGGLEQANTFLKRWIPKITRSAGYKNHGLVIVTFDEAEAEPGEEGDASACCNEQPGPNTPNPGGPIPGPGGGRIGAVMLSPCIKAGTESDKAYNHYSMLRSIEDNFGLEHLGYAGQDGLRPFGADILNNPACGERMHLRVDPRTTKPNHRQTFDFHVASRYQRCRQGVVVKIVDPADRADPNGLGRDRTGKKGNVSISARVPGPGKLKARANKNGCLPGRTSIRVR